jgi:SLOG cluster2
VTDPGRIGLSVSESADLARLGLVERHLRLALGEVARAVIRAGFVPVYGGHLGRDGYTAFLESEMERYGSTDRPLELLVGWSEHRSLSLSDLRRHRDDLGLRARITYLDEEGGPIDYDRDRQEDPVPVDDVPRALTALRRRLIEETSARVLIGGKERDYKGEMAGVLEEALFAIEAEQPLYLAGGFGGATATIAAALTGMGDRWPPTEDAIDPTPLREAMGDSGWALTANGLSAEENLQLAVTHRPGEVASLVAIGLKRTFNV